MKAFLLISFAVSMTLAMPQYGYNYEPSTAQQSGLLQQTSFLSTPLVQSKSIDASQSLQQVQTFQSIGTYTPQEQFFQPVSTTSVPLNQNSFTAALYPTQGSYEQNSNLFGQPQPPISSNLNGLTGFTSQQFQTDFSNGVNGFDQTQHFNAAHTYDKSAELSQLQQYSAQLSQELNKDDTAGTLDSFHILSTFGPNPQDVAPPSLKKSQDQTDSISVDAQQNPNNQYALFQPETQPKPQPQQLSQTVSVEKTAAQLIAPAAQPQAQAIIQKHIYVHVPPPDFEKPEPVLTPIVTNKKHYNIIFIKAPAISQSSSVIQQLQSEDKTIVYVLVKKPEFSAIPSLAIQPEGKIHKPEVFFIKYKTKNEGFSQANQQAPLSNESIVEERSKKLSQVSEFPALEKENDFTDGDSAEQNFAPSTGSSVNSGISPIPADLVAPQSQYLPPN